jgi:hypothetical protein
VVAAFGVGLVSVRGKHFGIGEVAVVGDEGKQPSLAAW